MQKSTKGFCTGIVVPFKTYSLCILLCCLAPVALFAQSYKSLNNKVQISLQQTNAEQVVKLLEKQTPFTYVYDPEHLSNCKLQTVKFPNNTLGEVLDYLDQSAPIDIDYNDNTVAIRKGKQTSKAIEENGTITGKVVDNKNEGLPGVTVLVNGSQGTVTSVDGSYTIPLPPGKYTVEYRYISFTTQRVTDVLVAALQNTPLNIVMAASKNALKEVVVTANFQRSSVEGLYALQKNNAGITDGISADLIARTPDKNVGEVLKRVSGLATVDNRYVVIRGLSERYNQAMLNNQIMPSTELNRKNFSYDVIPTSLIENITVIKTLTPGMSAEFGGGLVEVNTLDVPTRNFLNIGIGASYNDNTTGKNFRLMGFDGREYWATPSKQRDFAGKLNWNSRAGMIKAFDASPKNTAVQNSWGINQWSAQPSSNYRIALGRTMKMNNGQAGLVAGFSYRNNLNTQDIQSTRAGFINDLSVLKNPELMNNSKRYLFNTNMSGLVGLGFRNAQHKVSLNGIMIRNLDQSMQLGSGQISSVDKMAIYDITAQTELYQAQLKGDHALGKKGMKLKWWGSYTYLDRKKPDNHEALADYMHATDEVPGELLNVGSIGSSMISVGSLRWWSRAVENNLGWDASLSMPFTFKLGNQTVNNTVKGGYGGWTKDRKFYVMNLANAASPGEKYPYLGDVFAAPYLDSIFVNQFGDDMNKTAVLHSVYGMLDHKLGDKLRLVWGLRGEYINLNRLNEQVIPKVKALLGSGYKNDIDMSALFELEPNWHLFPSANLTYSLTQKINLRLAYAKSIVRPDLREYAYFREFDFELGGDYQGGMIRSTLIDHYDFRFEYYPKPGEVMSVSLFYKYLKNPLEIYKEGINRQYSLYNNHSATNTGIELELRKSLAFTNVPVIRNLSVYGNFTYLDAYVTQLHFTYFPDNPQDPKKIIVEETKGEREHRPQSGASNFMYNFGLYYDTKPVSLSVMYNKVTNRMYRPSLIYTESLYEQPIESLDAQLAFRMLQRKLELRLNASNLLNSISYIYRNYTQEGGNLVDPSKKDIRYQKDRDVLDYSVKQGRTFSATFTYNF
ncbi:TonB-dependent receptor-like protein [Chitinophaga skermanii]|uniref:TonB-dependent receptor-like protein n=1 Tax=Chitinophaga skermanii TaxID=331697 RepID=A0A327Q7H7_9BACT|nr:TonB-dependent receptor [Chitinophaga skermanii]RAI99691.1 TonB-dependent receptor-like protein [Chitinophaga skermanii]